jgi:hypothetical protein
MGNVSRRAFLATAAVGVCTVHGSRPALASSDFGGNQAPPSQIALVNALNFSSFARNKDELSLSAVMSMRPIDGKLGSFPSGSLLLFPFSIRASQRSSAAAFLPGQSADNAPIAVAPIATLGLPPDEFFCHYVIQATPQSFISCEVGAPIGCDDSRGPWHGNVAIAGEIVGFRWTSSNLNDRWFEGSHWIPDSDDGVAWRDRFIEGVRAAVLASRSREMS